MRKQEAKKENTYLKHIFSKETEQMVLGCMITSSENLCSAYEKENLSSEDFYYPEHKTIYFALESLYKNNRKADVHLLSEELKRQERLKTVGGVEHLVSLASIAGTSAFFEAYIQDLQSLSRRRTFIQWCEEFQNEALNSELDSSSLATQASERFAQFARKTQRETTFQLREISRGEGSQASFFNQLKEKVRTCAEKGKSLLPGFSTGYSSLDEILGGFREENFVLVAARPSVGKTAFALNLIRNLGIHQNIPVAFFSLEMTRSQIFLRLLSSQSGISANRIETGKLKESELEQIETGILQLENSPIFINDSCYNVGKIISQMRKLAEEYGVKVFFIDYIGLVEPIKQRDLKAYEIGDITRSFKNFANEARLPIVCLAQLNRQADNTNRPQLSMLRDSGNLEQDADSVIFLHRRDLYDPNDKPDQIEAIIAKNRHGITTSKTYHFKKELGTISEFIDVEQTALSWEE